MVDAGTVELIRGLGSRGGDVGEPGPAVRSGLYARSSETAISKRDEESTGVRREAFAKIGDGLRAGERVTEWDIKQFILARYKEAGIFIDHGPDVAVNANASNPHYDPTQDACSEIKKGDLVLIDMWGKLEQPESIYLRHYLGRVLRGKSSE